MTDTTEGEGRTLSEILDQMPAAVAARQKAGADIARAGYERIGFANSSGREVTDILEAAQSRDKFVWCINPAFQDSGNLAAAMPKIRPRVFTGPPLQLELEGRNIADPELAIPKLDAIYLGANFRNIARDQKLPLLKKLCAAGIKAIYFFEVLMPTSAGPNYGPLDDTAREAERLSFLGRFYWNFWFPAVMEAAAKEKISAVDLFNYRDEIAKSHERAAAAGPRIDSRNFETSQSLRELCAKAGFPQFAMAACDRLDYTTLVKVER